MMGHETWKGRTSPLLYLYPYLGIAILTLIASRFFGGMAWAVGIGGISYLILLARSMRYKLTKRALYFSPSLDDKEASIVELADIQHIYVIDRQPWRFWDLGTVILVIEPGADLHPCMKCLPAPHQLAHNIKAAAEACGADNIPILIVT